MQYARCLALIIGVVLVASCLVIVERYQEEQEYKKMEQAAAKVANPVYLMPLEELPYGDAEAYKDAEELK